MRCRKTDGGWTSDINVCQPPTESVSVLVAEKCPGQRLMNLIEAQCRDAEVKSANTLRSTGFPRQLNRLGNLVSAQQAIVD